jgi:murein DD-endopeptidase MepM/ murein hydrolase activator NlpD
MYYQNPYKHKNKADKKTKFIKKISFELMGIFVIMLMLMLFKYANTNITNTINDTVKNIIFSDYTEKTVETFNSVSPYISNIINMSTKQKTFQVDFLPVDDIITDNYGQRKNPVTKKDEIHTGIDINAKEGTEVKAVFDGTVESVEETKEFGLTVILDHGNGFKTKYSHLSSAKVNVNDKVVKQQIIALSGNTGNSTGPHLHFEIIKDGSSVDPASYIKIN